MYVRPRSSSVYITSGRPSTRRRLRPSLRRSRAPAMPTPPAMSANEAKRPITNAGGMSTPSRAGEKRGGGGGGGEGEDDERGRRDGKAERRPRLEREEGDPGKQHRRPDDVRRGEEGRGEGGREGCERDENDAAAVAEHTADHAKSRHSRGIGGSGIPLKSDCQLPTMRAPRWAKVTSNSSTSTSWTPTMSVIRCLNSPRTARCRSATSALSQKLRLRVVPARESIIEPTKPSRSRSQRSISSPTMVAFPMSWLPVLTRTIVTCTVPRLDPVLLLRRRNRELGPDGPVFHRRGADRLARGRAGDDADVRECMADDDRQAAVEAAVGVGCQRQLGEHTRRLPGNQAVGA